MNYQPNKIDLLEVRKALALKTGDTDKAKQLSAEIIRLREMPCIESSGNETFCCWEGIVYFICTWF